MKVLNIYKVSHGHVSYACLWFSLVHILRVFESSSSKFAHQHEKCDTKELFRLNCFTGSPGLAEPIFPTRLHY